MSDAARYDLLPWDTEHFGFGVARIVSPMLEVSELQSLLGELRQRDVRLVYWFAEDSTQAVNVAQQCGGSLVDRKVTYLTMLNEACLAATISNVIVWPADQGAGQLEALAIQSGEHSRFAVDPRFPRPLFEQLYWEWIRKSVSGELAERVHVVEQNGQPVGLITLGCKASRGDIGLVAVDASVRGRGIGTSLLAAALRSFFERGISEVQVVTQAANAAACRLYERQGFAVESIQAVFHFWLDGR